MSKKLKVSVGVIAEIFCAYNWSIDSSPCAFGYDKKYFFPVTFVIYVDEDDV